MKALAVLFVVAGMSLADDPVPSPPIRPGPLPPSDVPVDQLPKQPPSDPPPPGSLPPGGGSTPAPSLPAGASATLQLRVDLDAYAALASLNKTTAQNEYNVTVASYLLWTKQTAPNINYLIKLGDAARVRAQASMARGYLGMVQEHKALIRGDYVLSQSYSTFCAKAWADANTYFRAANQCFASAQSLLDNPSSKSGK